MSLDSDLSDTEILEKKGEKDDDFRIEDYRNEIDSDDSCNELPETNKDDNENNENQEHQEEQEEDQYVGPVLPDGHRFDKKFVCVKYPGNVVNDDRAIQTLGGINNISAAVDAPNRRLELHFRPDDVFSKPACGDRHKTHAFLLRIRIKKSRLRKMEQSNTKETDTSTDSNIKVDGNDKSRREAIISPLAEQVQKCNVNSTNDCNEEQQKDSASGITKDLWDMSIDNEKNTSKSKSNIAPTFDRDKYEDLSKDEDYELPKLKVLGRVDTEFRFRNLCDFQYVPMTQSKTDPTKLECIYDKIYPTTLPSYSWLKNDVPYFLPPAAFSRMDTVQHYVPKTEVDSLPENIIGKSKKRRAGFTNYIYFSTPNVPCSPPPGIETAMKVKFVQNVHLEQMRKIFEERPIWSKNAVMYETKFSSDRLKILLPSVAYYFMNGPWKIMWVRLGYDPRKDVSARKYQTLDYRLKAMHGLGSTVKCKRNYSNYTLPYKSVPVMKQKTMILHAMNTEQSQKKDTEHLNENVYIYREGMVPPSRQMFYQYCDVHVDEIQEMLAKLPDPLPGTKCHEKWGWLPSGFDVQCREIINRQVRAVLRKQMNIPEDHPTSLPRKRKRGIRVKHNRCITKRTKRSRVKAPKTEEEDDPEPSTSTNET